MSIPTLIGTDPQMREAVMHELEADPRLDASGIGVSAQADAALHRNADLSARFMQVNIVGSVATLRGHVSSWAQRVEAERAVADAPGVSRIDNQLEIWPTEI